MPLGKYRQGLRKKSMVDDDSSTGEGIDNTFEVKNKYVEKHTPTGTIPTDTMLQ